MAAPISPDEVSAVKSLSFPDEVIEVFNALIAENWTGSSARVLQSEAVSRIAASLGISRQACFDLNYLDVEDLYRDQGWEVDYDKPGYNESYPATFSFAKRKRGRS